MSEAEPGWRSTIYIALPAPSAPAILMLPSDAGWTLPVLYLARRIWISEAGVISEACTDQLGLSCVVLRCLAFASDDEQHTRELIFALEPASPDWLPPAGSMWVNHEMLANLTLAHPEQRVLLESVLIELVSSEIPPVRPPWARSGWMAEAASWVEQELARHGDRMLTPVEQVRNWGISAILIAKTTRGTVYFKAANQWELAANEPFVVQTLAGWYPQSVPAPLAVDIEHRWMLMDEFGGMLGNNPDLTLKEAALRAYAPLQIDSASRLDALRALGCVDRRLETLPSAIDALLTDDEMMALLTPAEAEQFASLVPTLKVWAAKLATYNLPATLVHGDLHSGNVAVEPDRFLFYDWTDACIAHPFMDLITMLDDQWDDAEARAKLCDVYLSQWTIYEPMERLQEAWALAQPLAALHQVLSYRSIYRVLEASAKFEFAEGVTEWVSRLLQIAASSVTPPHSP